ncbi:MAG: sugar ABC transporter permease [Bifidobacteriaceae bacterium]|nr:sugar ABC transporter permease [Bifidobacteriaceae bacterium]
MPYVFLAPALVLYGAFMLYPVGRAVHLSLFDWDGMGLGVFVGLRNYADLAADGALRASFVHAAVLMIFYCAVPLVIGVIIAAVLNRGKVRGLGFFRTVFFVPQVIAMVVVATAWAGIYAFNGPLNQTLRSLGLGFLAVDWLGSYTWALPAIGLIGTWVEIGLVTVLMLSGMAKINPELYEAARLDGAGAIREFFAVTWPCVVGETAVALTLTIVAALKTFDLVYMTTSGGPGNSTTVPSYQVYYQAFRLHDVGMAAAIGVALTALIFAVNLVVNRLADRAEA